MSSTVNFRLPQVDISAGADERITYDTPNKVVDSDLVKNTFLMNLDGIHDDEYTRWAYRTTADNEFFNTSLGGHIALCYPYGFTRLADIPRKGLLEGRPDIADDLESIDLGYGRYHSEAFSKNAQPRILHLEFGTPKFRSMFSFYTTAVNFRASVIANEGRSPTLYNAGKIAGTVLGLYFFPLRAGAWYIAKFVLDGVFGLTDTKYYSLKPAMHRYLQSAQNILTILLAERGLLSIQVKDDGKDKYGSPAILDASALKGFQEQMPGIFNSAGSLDIMKIVARPQLITNKYLEDMQAMLKSGDAKIPYVRKVEPIDLQEANTLIQKSGGTSYGYEMDEDGREITSNVIPPPATGTAVNFNITDSNDLSTMLEQDKDSWNGDGSASSSDAYKYMKVVSNYGFEYVGFYVDYVGPSTTSFSNSTKDIPAKGMLNSVGGNFRDMRFNLSGGNIVGDTVDDLMKGARDVVMGGLDGFSGGLTNVLLALSGGGFIKFPKMWDDSSVTLPTHSFKVKLGGPFGNAVSRAIDIDVPLSLLLSAILPQAIGNESYTSPFLCRAFLRGIMDIDMGMLTELSVTAAEGDLGRDKYGAPLSIEVSFTITDFSDIAVTPTYTGKLGAYYNSLDDNNPLTNFLRTIGGRSFMDSRYLMKNAKFRKTVLVDGAEKAFTPASIAAMTRDTVVGDLLAALNSDRAVSKIWEN